ncbi:MAG: glutathione S-transferase [Alteromonadaceae bacterium]|jgi:glutathione S-transferase
MLLTLKVLFFVMNSKTAKEMLHCGRFIFIPILQSKRKSPLKIYGDTRSGNCYKLQLLASLLNLDYQWIAVDILKGETRLDEFVAKNSNGKVPLLELDDGRCITESNAIVHYLAQNSPLLPTDHFEQAKALQWMFFEQYSHEPYIAVARFINQYLGLPDDRKAEYHSKQEGGHKALAVMEAQLTQTPYLVGQNYTIADICLYGYTHVADEGGFDLSGYPGINAWLKRIAAQPKHCLME